MAKSPAISVFISYSRKDADFVDRLKSLLESNEIIPIVDRDGIESGEKWRNELTKLILEATVFVAVVTENYVNSPTCRWEAEEAERRQKRILPLILRSVEPSHIFPELNERQFFPGDREFDLSSDATDLIETLHSDATWLRDHARYSTLAERWEISGRSSQHLLTRGQLQEALKWCDEHPPRAPELPTTLSEYISESQQHHAKRKRLSLIVTWGVAIAIPIAAAVFGSLWIEVSRKAMITESSAEAWQSDGLIRTDPQEAIRLAISAHNRLLDYPTANLDQHHALHTRLFSEALELPPIWRFRSAFFTSVGINVISPSWLRGQSSGDPRITAIGTRDLLFIVDDQLKPLAIPIAAPSGDSIFANDALWLSSSSLVVASGEQVASEGVRNGALRIYDRSGTLSRTLLEDSRKEFTAVASVQLGNGNDLLLAGDSAGDLTAFLEHGRPLTLETGAEQRITRVFTYSSQSIHVVLGRKKDDKRSLKPPSNAELKTRFETLLREHLTPSSGKELSIHFWGLESQEGHECAAVLDDNIYLCEPNGTITIGSLADPSKTTSSVLAHNARTTAITVEPTLQLIATGSDNGELRIWDATLSMLNDVSSPNSRAITAIGWINEGQQIVVGGLDTQMRRFDVSMYAKNRMAAYQYNPQFSAYWLAGLETEAESARVTSQPGGADGFARVDPSTKLVIFAPFITREEDSAVIVALNSQGKEVWRHPIGADTQRGPARNFRFASDGGLLCHIASQTLPRDGLNFRTRHQLSMRNGLDGTLIRSEEIVTELTGTAIVLPISIGSRQECWFSVNDRIHVLPHVGTLRESPPFGDNSFTYIRGLSADRKGNVYVLVGISIPVAGSSNAQRSKLVLIDSDRLNTKSQIFEFLGAGTGLAVDSAGRMFAFAEKLASSNKSALTLISRQGIRIANLPLGEIDDVPELINISLPAVYEEVRISVGSNLISHPTSINALQSVLAKRLAEWSNRTAAEALIRTPLPAGSAEFDRQLRIANLMAESAQWARVAEAAVGAGMPREKAMGYLDTALANDPSDYFALFQKGKILKEIGRHNEAILTFERMIAMPSFMRGAPQRGGIESLRPVTDLLNIMATSPFSHFEPRVWKAMTLADLNRWADVQAEMSRYRSLQMTPFFHYLLGLADVDQGSPKSGLEQFQIALERLNDSKIPIANQFEIDRDYAGPEGRSAFVAQVNLAVSRVYSNSGDPDNAREYRKRANAQLEIAKSAAKVDPALAAKITKIEKDVEGLDIR